MSKSTMKAPPEPDTAIDRRWCIDRVWSQFPLPAIIQADLICLQTEWGRATDSRRFTYRKLKPFLPRHEVVGIQSIPDLYGMG